MIKVSKSEARQLNHEISEDTAKRWREYLARYTAQSKSVAAA
jgi:hypothetical protein